jgi:leucyl-tRNA synthetase
MSTSRGNVVNPVDIVWEYGADVPGSTEMFMGPHEAVKPWLTSQIQRVFVYVRGLDLNQRPLGYEPKAIRR